MSFYGAELQKYTSFKGHASESVKQILFTDKGVLSVSSHSVHLSSRTGLTIWHLTHELFHDLQCMSFTSKGTHEVLVAGCQDSMFKIDVENGTISETVSSTDYLVLEVADTWSDSNSRKLHNHEERRTIHLRSDQLRSCTHP